MTDDVFLFKADDPKMQQAYVNAQNTFKYFWRELAWERRRIVPGLEMACVKAPFFGDAKGSEKPEAEHMWLDDVEFDGVEISGVLLNQPNWVTTVNEGDHVSLPLAHLSDWMYAIDSRVYGAFTVNVLREKMGPAERNQHDDAWDMDFGDPNNVLIVPESFYEGADPSTGTVENLEHPMSVNGRQNFVKFLTANPAEANSVDKNGFSFLHHQTLAGSLDSVEVLLDFGANPNLPAKNGQTPFSLASTMKWPKIIEAFKKAGVH